MFFEDIASVLKDPTTPDALCRKVLRENNMDIRKRFSSVRSEYLVQDKPTRRMRYLLLDDMYQKTEENLINGIWEPRYRYTYEGLQKNVEKKFFRSLSRFIKNCTDGVKHL